MRLARNVPYMAVIRVAYQALRWLGMQHLCTVCWFLFTPLPI
ncbi:hypothetical protein BIFGAL_02577 [Bifidobacterium gallicum DSM 20093 = LMG 11596]|uniref:Uncharacterized protein n=1 Tax=Bifidobacterium gallicum DSM 20093 = LMG 11596 TaxID=561180 RepID=D1NS23_9BIFI|nr:hypothetical protein BIFGAL_02577 [Bifidobacterium gallicum DSM 20093 = LMG 11596]